jgi:hypothetical protein
VARVYVAASLASLAEYAAARLVPAAAAERVVAPADDEETEYAALMTAADLSARAQPAGARRVVLVAETADPDADLAWTDVVAVHADDAPGAGPEDDLAWYATQEIDDLLG